MSTATALMPAKVTKSAPRTPVKPPSKSPASSDQFATLLDETQQGILVVDKDCRVTYANFSVTLMFPQRAVMEQADLSDSEETRETFALLRQSIDEQRRVQGEVRVCMPVSPSTNCERIYRVAAAPTATGAWCILDDITDHVLTEQIRKDFVTNASHELRTPLSLIHGYIETLQSGMIKSGASMNRCLEVMEKHSKRMMRIIEDMLTISRLESEEAQLKLGTFHVRACVEDVLEHLTPVIELRQPVISLEFPTDGGLLQGDRFYWDQIFTNLIENALKENPRTGLHLRIAGEWSEDECVLTVSDDGVGIPAEDVPFVFKRFYRCGKDRAHETKGTGLGLSIVKRAVEAHGGTIELYSTPGVETTFVMRIPAPTASV